VFGNTFDVEPVSGLIPTTWEVLKMRSLSRHRPIGAFLLLMTVITILVFGLPLLSQGGLEVVPVELPGVAPFVLVAALSIFATSRWVTSAAEGPKGVRAFRRRVFRFRVNPLWFVLALAMLPMTALVTASVATGSNVVAEFFTRPDLMLAVVVEAVIAFMFVNWWEEAAFTGFVLHRLQPRIGPVRASVVTTWVQALAHVPLVFVAGGVTEGRVPADEIMVYLAALFILPIPVRMLITWLYNTTGKSIPVVGLFHAGLGVATGTVLIPEITNGFNQTWVYAGFAIVASIVLAFTRGKLGYQSGAATDSERGFDRLRVSS
jgi:membrane protease YdiL (CAAX protease family)